VSIDEIVPQLDLLVSRLERAAEQLRSGDVSTDAAATLVEDAAALASQASGELEMAAREDGSGGSGHPGQDALL
jgi:exonuclease VII small subunit